MQANIQKRGQLAACWEVDQCKWVCSNRQVVLVPQMSDQPVWLSSATDWTLPADHQLSSTRTQNSWNTTHTPVDSRSTQVHHEEFVGEWVDVQVMAGGKS